MSRAKRKPLCGASLRWGKIGTRSMAAEAVAVHRQPEVREAEAVPVAVGVEGAVEEELDVADARVLLLHAGVESVAADDAPAAGRVRQIAVAAQLGLVLGELDRAERIERVRHVAELEPQGLEAHHLAGLAAGPAR